MWDGVKRSAGESLATLHAYRASSARSPLRVPIRSPVVAAPVPVAHPSATRDVILCLIWLLSGVLC